MRNLSTSVVTTTLTAVLTFVVVTGCGDPAPVQAGASSATSRPTRPPVSLADARTRWAGARIADYELVVARTCFCTNLSTVRVTVRAGRPVDVALVANGYPNAGTAPPMDTPTTVEALFDRVAEEQRRSEKVTVTYDPQTGVPVQLDADRMVKAIDDEESYAVTFTPARPT